METADCRVEKATLTDARAMLDFWRNIPGLGVGRGDDEDRLKAFMDQNASTCLVLRDKEQLIGTVLGGFDGRRGYIYHLAVHQDYRGRGYGRLLLSSVTQALRTRGALKMHLFVFNHNQAASAFYQSEGWELRRDIQVFSWNADQTGY